MLRCSNCDCCGKICTNHDEKLLERENIIKQSHLTKITYKAWRCCCRKTFNGETKLLS